jgi:hypothetical protein
MASKTEVVTPVPMLLMMPAPAVQQAPVKALQLKKAKPARIHDQETGNRVSGETTYVLLRVTCLNRPRYW